jgi:glycosyltransferase involved in cell wall biosynthesis
VADPLQTPPFGAIASFEHGRVEGWAFDPAHPSDRLRVIVLIDGDLAGFGHAGHWRQDLAERRVGDHAHGFVCIVSKTKLYAASLLTLLAETRSGLVLIAERPLKPRPAPPDARRGTAVHFDITDLLEFMFHHREVSGIQRVQCGYLANALAAQGEVFTVRVCIQQAGLHRYVEIGRETIETILHDIESRRTMSDLAWREHIVKARIGTGAPPDFQPGDVLLVTGAPWVYGEYFRAVEDAKRDHGVFYVQISYDLIPVMLPESASFTNIAVFNRSTAGTLDLADHILAISRHSKHDLLLSCARLGVVCPPLSVIPLGATLDYHQDTLWPPMPPDDGTPSPRALYGDYVLCVGTIEPRKNHPYLYAIWKRMLAQRARDGDTRPVPKLVCVGRMGWHMEDFQRHLQVSGHLGGHFVHLAGIGDDALKRLYRDCLFTVFPSLYEGWGLPVAESLLFGKLCVSSGTTSMPEVGGDFALYVDPYNIEEGYQTITGLLEDRPRLAALEQNLRQAYHPITWRAAAARMMQVLADAHAGLPVPEGEGAKSQRLPSLELGRAYEFRDSPPQGGALRQLGAEIALRAAGHLLAPPDWYEMEEWGVWSSGQAARLGFKVEAAPSYDLSCYLVLRLPSDVPKIDCDILVNGVGQGRVTLDAASDHEIRIVLPAAALPDIRIELRLRSLVLPAAGDGDQRLRGIGLRSVFVCEADDRSARLAYFTRRMAMPTRLLSFV